MRALNVQKTRVALSVAVISLTLLVSALVPGTALAVAGDLVLASSTAESAAGANHSGAISISADGRYVVFNTTSNNFPGWNGPSQVYRKDLTTGAIVLVSCTAAGVVGASASDKPRISSDGRYVAFQTQSSNFPGYNGSVQIYRKDLATGAIDLASSTALNVQGATGAEIASINSDGRFVAFRSHSSNFPGQAVSHNQVYRKDLTTHALALVSCTAGGDPGAGDSDLPSINSDGRYVAFLSLSSNFPDTGPQIFRKDLNSGAIVLVSCTAGGVSGASASYNPAISSDGRYVAFYSVSNNFPGQNGQNQVFRKDLTASYLVLVSSTAAGVSGAADSFDPSISADGRYVAFSTTSNNFPGQNGNFQVYRKDATIGAIDLASCTVGGVASASGSVVGWDASISADGCYAVFYTASNNFPGQNGFNQVYRKQLDNLIPTTTSIDPASAFAGSPGITLTVNGTNYMAGSVVRWNGSDRTTTYVSPSQLRAAIPASDLASAGTANVTVFNPAPGGGISNAQTFNINSFASATWYLAEGSTAWGFSAYITIENPNNAACTAQMTYMPTGVPNVSEDIGLPANSQTTLSGDHLVQVMGGARDFSTKVTCKEGLSIAVDRTMVWTGPGAKSQEGHSSVGVNAPSNTWYLPEGSTAWGFECWLLIQNPNAQTANCQVTYMIEGEGPRTFTKQVGPNTRQTFDVSKDIGAKDASIKVVSDVPVIPERAMYRNNRREGHESIGTTATATDYFLAEGAIGYASGFTTYVLVQNPQSTPTNVSITYMTQNGSVTGPAFQMPANTRKTIRVNDQLPVNTDVSTMVHGSQPIIAERAMYWGATSSLGEACHDSIGLDFPHQTFYLPDGQTTGGYETWTLVQNPNPGAVTVQISYLTPSGANNVVFTDEIPAGSRKTYNMADRISGRAAIMVRSMDGARPVMVERSMYWNNRGAGTDTIGGFSD